MKKTKTVEEYLHCLMMEKAQKLHFLTVLYLVMTNKKFELMLTRRAKAYSSSCSAVLLKIEVFTLS